MQHENLFPVVQDVAGLAGRITKKELRLELERMMQAAGGGSGQRDSLNAFKDREMFRIDMRQIMGHTPDFEQFSAELTDLAEVVLEAAYRLCIGELRKDFGLPHLANGRDCPVTICALGKMGGGELGFASDIELMFIFAGIGQTTGPRVITTTDFYDRLTRQVKYTIRTRHEGIFELDLQLRPYGKAGSMAVSLDAFQRYFAPSGDAWPYERQALIKLRPIAGDEKLGHKVEELRDQYLYNGAPFDVAAMRAMRERQIRHLVAAGTINAKFSPGALADLEYLIQGLQITHGHKNRTLRLTNTGAAMLALKKAGILTAEDYTQLNEAFLFLRRLINALRVVRGNAKDLTVPPPDSDEFAFLARRLSYSSDLARLWNDLTHHTGTVQQLNYRLLG
jgi:glutamate-ammonia-ligase adenylyltransferase